MLEQISLLLISLISNIFSAFSGGGAGVIQLPAILILFNIPNIDTLAIHKIATVALGSGATSKFSKIINFEKELVSKLLLIGLPGVYIGAQMISIIDEIGISASFCSLALFPIKN